ncbi:MAG: hypothetical protein JW900_06620 [Anaerolineae bacterium]|nr:hypothetical protein [Anaerolineae bacterium]
MKRALVLLALLAALLWVSPAMAQSGGGYDLSWNTVDGGGATFNTAEGYRLGGTVGQPDAAQWQGGSYVLAGGFWHSGIAAAGLSQLYLPLILRAP